MICPICEETKWIDMDYLRTKKENFAICECCGFVTYLKTEKEITDMYKVSDHNAVRKFAGSSDNATKNHKLPYHKKMLTKYLESIPQANVLDYGCSTGYILNWIKNESKFNIANIEGIELNPAHAEYGRQEYGLTIHEIAKLSELPDELTPQKLKKGDEEARILMEKKKYDLIINFAVLEHIVDPVNALKEMRDKLTDDGIIYLMTPIWLDTLYTSEYKIQPFEQLYVPHHINVFTATSRENCFKLVGLEVIEHNNAMYGDMVILKKCDPSDKIVKENAKLIQELISKQKKAIELMFANKIDQAIVLWEKNPEYCTHMALKSKDDLVMHEKWLLKGIETCPTHAKLHENLGHFYMQCKRYDEAKKKFIETIEMCPNMYQSYWYMSEMAFIDGDYKEAVKWLKQLIDINPSMSNSNFVQNGDTVLDRLGICYAKMV